MKTIPVIPTTSMIDLWERVGDKLDPYITVLRALGSRAEDSYREEVNPWFHVHHSPVNHHAQINYDRRKHGPISIADAVNLIEEHDLMDAFINALAVKREVTGDAFRFVNTPAGILAPMVKKLRTLFCLRHGIPMSSRTGLMLVRVLSLSCVKSSRGHTLSDDQLFTDSTLKKLNSEFNNIFVGVRVDMVQRGVMKPVSIIGGEFWEQEFPSG